ncbi:osmotically inducible protein OsmC [Taibaiella sp. KBW10]|uniref:OsmC family protein n=1 Tax=Taibaiella sp. KBW10 TaxID=2153357 RepID=UPI000F5B18B6|nr:OsmC family protein [Taibaiella sp. KBW10]RQO31027.1 osmotically inducible protein OsmC [Taibaiella sp. KBW10]
MTSKIIYKGDLRTEATHLQSGSVIETDAPTDNKGKGERFSPTDIVATALGSCMLTIMGIAGNTHNINIVGTTCDITKLMAENPRRIGGIKVNLNIIGQESYSSKEKMILEHAAMTCPVIESLHPEIEKVLTFTWNGVAEN